MPDYAKMKNADLEALLKERGLPHTGKKAEMVDRLIKDDEKTKASELAAKPDTTAEDEIDWEDDADEPVKPAAAEALLDAANAISEPSAAAIRAGGIGQVANPQAVPNQVADVDPSKTDDLKAPGDTKPTNDAKAEEQKPEEPAVDFTKGLAATNLDEEIEKRKARAKKFGLKIEDDEGLKKLERAKKFGETAAPKGLDEALPERSRKRGRDVDDDRGRNKRRGGGGFGGGRGRGNGRRDDRRDGRRDNRKEERSAPSNGSWMSDADKAKAEARKKKFALPAAST